MRGLTLEQLILTNFSDIEKKILSEINKRLILSENEPHYVIDNSINHATFNCKENIITLKNKNIFSSTLHELLHAELIHIYKFPSLNKIKIELEKHNLLRLKATIINITNDVHHFIFNEKYLTLTEHLENDRLFSNQDELLIPKFEFTYLIKKFNLNTDKISKVKFFYSRLYLPFKYTQLISNSSVKWNTISLKELDRELFEIIDNFFFKISNLDLEMNIYNNENNIIKIYNQLFENLEKYVQY